MQEAILLLALLYQNKFESNLFFQNDAVYRWCLAGIDFCKSIQHKDGSFDELYPNEQCFCATSFLSCAIAETLFTLNDKELLKVHLSFLGKSAQWLIRNNNLEATNQVAEAAACLSFAYKLTGKEEYRKAVQDKLISLLNLQDSSGYLLEYGGWDIGYLSISIASLAKIVKLKIDFDMNDEIDKMLNGAVKFVESKIHDDGTYDNIESSRNTQYLYPSGFIPAESKVIENLKKGLNNGRVLNPMWIDDRYCIALTIDYLRAYLESR